MTSQQRVPEPRGGSAPFGLIAATGLFGLLLGGAIQFVREGVEIAARERAEARLAVKAREVSERLGALLAGAVWIETPPEEAGTGICFREAPGLHSLDVEPPLHHLRFELEERELAHGRDDDGDGLVDEGRITLSRGDGRALVLCRGVAPLLQGELANRRDDNGNGAVDEPGFHVALHGRTTTLAITLQRVDPLGGLVTAHAEAHVRAGRP